MRCAWLGVGLVWLAAATVLGGWSWQRALILVVPLLLLALSLPSYLWPERLARRAQLSGG